jgi:toxin ParE1/3/4
LGSYRLPAHVEDRILATLDEGETTFGAAIRDRYARLIVRAMQDVAEEPRRPGAVSITAIDKTALFYHLRHSRTRLPRKERIRKPRHILVYELGADGIVDILGLIPDMVPVELALPRFITGRFA